MRKRKAQGILEYTLLLGAIIAVIVFVVMGNTNGLATRTKEAYQATTNAVHNTTTDADMGVFQE